MADDFEKIQASFRSFYGENVPGKQRPGASSPLRFRNPILPDLTVPFDPQEIRQRFLAGKTLDLVFASQIDPAGDVLPGRKPHRFVTGVDSDGSYRFQEAYFLDDLTPEGLELVAIQVEHAATNRGVDIPASPDLASGTSEDLARTLPPVAPVTTSGANAQNPEDAPPSPRSRQRPEDPLATLLNSYPLDEGPASSSPSLGALTGARIRNPLSPEEVIPDPDDLANLRASRGESLDFVFADQIDKATDLFGHPKGYLIAEGPHRGRTIYFLDDLTPEASARIYRDAYRHGAPGAARYQEMSMDDLTREAGRRIGLELQGRPVPPSSRTFGQKIDALGAKIGELPLRISAGLDFLRGRAALAGQKLYEVKKTWAPRILLGGMVLSLTGGLASLVLNKDPSIFVSSVAHHFTSQYPAVTSFFVEKIGGGLHHAIKALEHPPAEAAATPHEEIVKETYINQALSGHGIEAAHRHLLHSPHDLPPVTPLLPHAPPGHPVPHLAAEHVGAPSPVGHEAPRSLESELAPDLPRDPYERVVGYDQIENGKIVAHQIQANHHILVGEHDTVSKILAETRDRMQHLSAGGEGTDAGIREEHLGKIYQETLETLRRQHTDAATHIGDVQTSSMDHVDAETSHAYGHLDTLSSEGVRGQSEQANQGLVDARHMAGTLLDKTSHLAQQASDSLYDSAKKTLDEIYHHSLHHLQAASEQKINTAMDEHYAEEEATGPGF